MDDDGPGMDADKLRPRFRALGVEVAFGAVNVSSSESELEVTADCIVLLKLKALVLLAALTSI